MKTIEKLAARVCAAVWYGVAVVCACVVVYALPSIIAEGVNRYVLGY